MAKNGFNHSVKVGHIYKRAAKIICDVKENGKGVKNLVYQEKRDIKPIYALVVETINHGPQIDLLIRKSELLVKEARLDPWLARVLITELLWRKQKINGKSKPEQTILSYQKEFENILLNNSDVTTLAKSKQVTKPRYVRINTITLSVQDAIEGFRDEGWTFVRRPAGGYAEFLVALQNLTEDQFMVDFHIPELLIFPQRTEFYRHECYKDGRIILQDKASCLPAHILAPEPGSVVLDMCAAPGMKTTHLAAILNNEGSVYAVEIDQRRYQTLTDQVALTNSICVKPINRDVITLTNRECADVEYILVDPSCSGSGMIDRVTLDDPEAKSNKYRLEKLAGFQILILRHALTAFPKAKRVVYSTCSTFPEENEQVVQAVLASCNKFKLLCAKDLLNGEWFNLGSDEYENVGINCLYARPEGDLSNGFFVAVFERVAPADENDMRRGRKRKFQKNKNDGEENLEEDNTFEIKNSNKEVEDSNSHEIKAKKKKGKKSKNNDTLKEDTGEVANVDNENAEENFETQLTKKKSKKGKNKDISKEDNQFKEINICEEFTEENLEMPVKKKSKKHKNKDISKEGKQSEDVFDNGQEITEESYETSVKKKSKKHKNKGNSKEENQSKEISICEEITEENLEVPDKKKSKKRKYKNVSEDD